MSPRHFGHNSQSDGVFSWKMVTQVSQMGFGISYSTSGRTRCQNWWLNNQDPAIHKDMDQYQNGSPRRQLAMDPANWDVVDQINNIQSLDLKVYLSTDLNSILNRQILVTNGALFCRESNSQLWWINFVLKRQKKYHPLTIAARIKFCACSEIIPNLN